MRQKSTDLLGLVVRAPRTLPELAELTGMNKDNARAWLKLWVEEGLVSETHAPKRGTRGNRGYDYTWIGAPR